ncbi:MAG: flagellar hook protein FlgE [Burkholderiaceae bacterium]|jgi:flagellar hook protein FlgE|nr:flagellar hook protein FlgE [Gemmatimonadales bacterium]MCO5121473.1 flagellar hook protein FlgE [Burkholderiaceae bacterium]MEB2317796.1 flagellar hook protein FlgE [Pseudomonadota bacterium]
MGFQHGLSGLNAAARNLDVIGHNVANANTVGAKSSRAEFGDVIANTVYGSGAQFGGLGVQVDRVAQQFSQGDLASTANPLDLAINGSGFFRLSDNGMITYSRNGQFGLDKDGYIVNSGGSRLTGYPADGNGVIQPGVPADLRMVTGDISPRATSSVEAMLNLDSRAEARTAAFDLDDPTTYNSATSLGVFDAQGGDTTLALYFQKTAANTWDVYAAADGNQIGTTPVGQLSFQANGTVDTAASPMPITIAVPNAQGGVDNVEVDLGSSTQYGSVFGVNHLSQDGFTTGRLAGYSISDEGIITARYTNGQTRAQGQVALANFPNPQGLVSLGGNVWAESAESGVAMVGSPASASLGVIQSGALEQSNVDLTAELVNMITAQRSYQANAQTIKTQDQILQTIVNLR